MRKAVPAITAFLLFAALARAAAPGAADAQTEIDAFNRALIDATRKMDNAASMALWEDDGMSLLPSTPPLVGKAAIAAFLEKVMSQLTGARMESFTCDCATVFASGDWASERCVEHQVVQFPGGKPPFDGRGNILYVLHRGTDGRFRVRAEMWNPAAAETLSEPAPK